MRRQWQKLFKVKVSKRMVLQSSPWSDHRWTGAALMETTKAPNSSSIIQTLCNKVNAGSNWALIKFPCLVTQLLTCYYTIVPQQHSSASDSHMRQMEAAISFLSFPVLETPGERFTKRRGMGNQKCCNLGFHLSK